jgi:bifunctional pyridoxal-dependent enzyme with beta-cystathionase and maltose regulon repressor activities
MDFSATGIAGDPAEFILEQSRVAASAAPPLGAGGETFIRLNFGRRQAIPAKVLSLISRAML